MSKLVVLSGIPGSGKSFFSKTLRKVKGSHVYIISSDKLREEVLGNPQDLSSDSLIWKMFYEMPKVYSMDKNGIVILDATHMFTSRRIEPIKLLKEYFDEIDLVYFDIDKTIILNQNLQRDWPVPSDAMESFFAHFEKPNDIDSAFFDHIYTINSSDIAKVIECI